MNIVEKRVITKWMMLRGSPVSHLSDIDLHKWTWDPIFWQPGENDAALASTLPFYNHSITCLYNHFQSHYSRHLMNWAPTTLIKFGYVSSDILSIAAQDCNARTLMLQIRFVTDHSYLKPILPPAIAVVVLSHTSSRYHVSTNVGCSNIVCMYYF